MSDPIHENDRTEAYYRSIGYRGTFDASPRIEETCSETRCVQLDVPSVERDGRSMGFVEITVVGTRWQRGDWSAARIDLEGAPLSPTNWPVVRDAIDRALDEYRKRFEP